MSTVEWYTGLNNFKKHTLESNSFNLEIIDQDFEQGRPLDIIICDNLKNLNNHFEVLYSGGIDSEFVLYSLVKNKIPVTAVTMIIKVKDCIVNTHDLYYAEKFCRQNNIKQVFHTLEVEDFFKSGEYENYLTPYQIIQPHVATHFWLIEKCSSFPIIGGDWPWVQCHLEHKKLSPFKLDYACYERFMSDKNIQGIGNMLSYSYEIAYTLSEKQMLSPFNKMGSFDEINILKQNLFPLLESRTKSYGWERFSRGIFNITQYHLELIKKVGFIKNSITWGNKYKTLINSNTYTHDKFK